MAKNDNYMTSFLVEQTPDAVFHAINDVRGWWSEEIAGCADKLGAEFVFYYRNFHRSLQKITEFVPGQKVVWCISDARINFVKDKAEWNGTRVVFEIARKGDKTEVRFAHVGLGPAIECYDVCSRAWGFYIHDSLHSLITTGEGQPAKKEEELRGPGPRPIQVKRSGVVGLNATTARTLKNQAAAKVPLSRSASTRRME